MPPKVIGASIPGTWGCDVTAWQFLISPLPDRASAPGSIHVAWANGQQRDIALGRFEGGTARYGSPLFLDSKVTSATASIYADWTGAFQLSGGPCAPEPTATSTQAGG